MVTEPTPAFPASRPRPPAVAIWSLALVVAPFLVAAAGLLGGGLEENPDRTSNDLAIAVSIGSEFVIPLVWIASIVVGVITVVAPVGRWRWAGGLAIVAPIVEAIAIGALLLYGLSTI
jgi:hypothetical protein